MGKRSGQRIVIRNREKILPLRRALDACMYFRNSSNLYTAVWIGVLWLSSVTIDKSKVVLGRIENTGTDILGVVRPSSEMTDSRDV
jgi:hypothetical protein